MLIFLLLFFCMFSFQLTCGSLLFQTFKCLKPYESLTFRSFLWQSGKTLTFKRSSVLFSKRKRFDMFSFLLIQFHFSKSTYQSSPLHPPATVSSMRETYFPHINHLNILTSEELAHEFLIHAYEYSTSSKSNCLSYFRWIFERISILKKKTIYYTIFLSLSSFLIDMFRIKNVDADQK